MADDNAENAGNASPMSEDDFDRLYDKARMAIHLARLDEARDIADSMVAARPESTTAHELMGDVYALINKLPEAEAEFRKASELEPANADALRKLGEVVLRRAAPTFDRLMIEATLADRSASVMHKPNPQAAAFRSGLFPGLGQLYNGDYERGLVMAGIGIVFLGLSLAGLSGAFPGVLSDIFPKHVHDIPLPSPYGWTELTIGGLGYTAVYLYSIWDAARTAREEADSGSLYTPPAPRT
jgi:tetratricopeptide (TPR) repeat protein